MDVVLGHQERGRLERRRRRDRDRLGRHPLAHARLARVHAAGERSKHVARGEDPDQAPVVGDEGRADVALAHPLGDLAERVLGRDDERVGGHDVADRRHRRLAERLVDGRLEQTVAPALAARRVELDLHGNARVGGRPSGASVPASPARNGAR